MSTSQEVVQRTSAEHLVAQVRSESFQRELSAALPDSVSVRRFTRATVTALLQNPDIAKAEPQSLFQSVIRCAQDGLQPDGREAALVMFGSKAQYMPMIGGFRKIAAEHGWTLRTRVVYANDEFEFTEEPPTLTHRPVRPGVERGDLVAAYAIALSRDGQRLQRVMYREDIEKRRAVARSQAVWNQWEPQMWEKTVGRDLFPEIPFGERDMERIRRVIDAADLKPGEAARMIYGPEIRPALTPGGSQANVTEDGRESVTDPEQGETGGGDGQQVAEAETDGAPAAGASAVPGDDEEPTPKAGPAFPIPDAVIDEAGEAVITRVTESSQVLKGQTIAQVCTSLVGSDWAAWALRRKDGYYSQPFRASLELYVEHRLADVWAAWKAEGKAT